MESCVSTLLRQLEFAATVHGSAQKYSRCEFWESSGSPLPLCPHQGHNLTLALGNFWIEWNVPSETSERIEIYFQFSNTVVHGQRKDERLSVEFRGVGSGLYKHPLQYHLSGLVTLIAVFDLPFNLSEWFPLLLHERTLILSWGDPDPKPAQTHELLVCAPHDLFNLFRMLAESSYARRTEPPKDKGRGINSHCTKILSARRGQMPMVNKVLHVGAEDQTTYVRPISKPLKTERRLGRATNLA